MMSLVGIAIYVNEGMATTRPYERLKRVSRKTSVASICAVAFGS